MTLELPLTEKPVMCTRCVVRLQYALKGIDYEMSYKKGVPCSNCGREPERGK